MEMTSGLAWNIATWLIPLVIAIVFHEVSHGWVANALGDPTAKQLGRLSFNPIKHVDPFGTVLLPMVLAVTGAPVFGWAKPVPVVSQRLRNPRYHMMLVALAGPGMNLLLALVASLLFAGLVALQLQGIAWQFITENLIKFVVINVFLAVFNMLPMPPFDGGHVVEGLLPPRLAVQYRKIGRYGFLLLIVLLLVVPMLFPSANVVERIVGPPVNWIIRLLLPNSVG
jgi:Zn-dependent protease